MLLEFISVLSRIKSTKLGIGSISSSMLGIPRLIRARWVKKYLTKVIPKALLNWSYFKNPKEHTASTNCNSDSFLEIPETYFYSRKELSSAEKIWRTLCTFNVLKLCNTWLLKRIITVSWTIWLSKIRLLG